jgi:Zn-dependent peptidase ImmA (M78 family)/transcriptional regulator with XRE-family HTH domain
MISGDRLRQARELAGLTQRELASSAGIPQPRLSNAERFGEDLPDGVLIDIATVTGFPPAFFETQPGLIVGDPPHFRAQSGASAAQLKQARRAGEVVGEQALVMRSQLQPPPLRLPAGTGDPRSAANAVRAAFGLAPTEPVKDLPLLAERNGVLIVAVPLPAFKKDAFSWWVGEVPVLALLSTDAGDRQAWSLAHELGHLVQHRGLTPQRTLEEEANEFAMHLLLPLDAFRRDLPAHPTLQDFALLKRRWGVSIQALIRTARRVGVIDDDRYTSLFRQISARGERLRERVSVPPVKPRGFRKMAEMLFGPSPAAGLGEQANWTPAFTEDVLARHATVSELPVRSSPSLPLAGNVTDLAGRRSRRRAQHA